VIPVISAFLDTAGTSTVWSPGLSRSG